MQKDTESQIMKGSQFIQSRAEHLCIYGDPGTGKSTIALELLTHGYNINWFSIDAGIPSSAFNQGNPRPFTKDELNRLNVYILRDTPQFQVGQQTWRKVIKGSECNICDAHGQVDCSGCRKAGADFSIAHLNKCGLDTINVFDHLTNFSNSALNTCWDGEAFVNSGEDVADDKTNSTFTTWRQQGWLLKDFLSRMQHAPFNTIVIAEEVMAVFDDGTKNGILKRAPHAGTRDFSSEACSYFGHVIYSHIKNGKHCFGSSSTYMNGTITKSRSHIKIEDMKIPSLVPFFVPLETARQQEIKSIPTVEKLSSSVSSGGSGPDKPSGISSSAALLAKMKKER